MGSVISFSIQFKTSAPATSHCCVFACRHLARTHAWAFISVCQCSTLPTLIHNVHARRSFQFRIRIADRETDSHAIQSTREELHFLRFTLNAVVFANALFHYVHECDGRRTWTRASISVRAFLTFCFYFICAIHISHSVCVVRDFDIICWTLKRFRSAAMARR